MIEESIIAGSGILETVDLAEIINQLWLKRHSDSDDGLENQAHSEHYLQEAYTDRYLFELIQNARDAAKAANVQGEILINLTDKCLSITNNGMPFNEEGIRGVTLIGASSKESGEFIGFKGIGFKSVQDVTNQPRIVTAYGTIVFDRQRSYALLSERFKSAEDLPLFFLPHYDAERLSVAERDAGMVTRVDLPLKRGVTAAAIEEAFSKKILRSTVLLLGSIKKITFISPGKNIVFDITPKPAHKIEVALNGKAYAYKVFKPGNKARISADILSQLSAKEEAVYGKDPYVDISVALRSDEKNHLMQIPDCKLYLYFPLRITSGFPFIIHSHFVVDPQRTALRPGPLNEFIAKEIGRYLGGDWFRAFKKDHAGNVLNFLAFTRNPDEPILDLLYDELVSQLMPQAFIYDHESRKSLRADQVMIAADADRKLFPGNKLNNKTLVYIEDDHVSDWLIDEFDVDVLEPQHILQYIEAECARQARLKNVEYFVDLYSYVALRRDINLREYNVLIDEEFRLFKGSDYVFNGMERSEGIHLSKTILRHIHIAHPKVRNSYSREIQDRLGFTEFGRDALVRRLLELYELSKPPYRDIVVALLSSGSSLTGLIRRNIRVPVISAGRTEWISALTNPVYLDTTDTRTTYPNGRFVNMRALQNDYLSADNLASGLAKLGVWQIPAMYFREGSRKVYPGEQPYEETHAAIYKTTPFYDISGDWLIDQPAAPNAWFSQSIIENWEGYRRITEETDGLRIRYQSQRSGPLPYPLELIFKSSSFFEYIVTQVWLVTEQGPGQLRDVLFAGPGDKGQRITQLRNYFRVLQLDYYRHDRFVRDTRAHHLDQPDFLSFRRMLAMVNRLYPDVGRMPELFRKAYHVILNKLFDLYASGAPERDTEITKFKSSIFLCRNDYEESFGWAKGSQVYFVENRIAFEAYPVAVQQVIQPQFTLMDKTRFGQMARRIGVNYREQIEEQLQPYEVEQEIPLTVYVRSLPECLALLEVKSETMLVNNSTAKQLSALQVSKCRSLTVEFYHQAQLLDSYNPHYKVTNAKKALTILVTEPLAGMEYQFFAGLVCSIVNELQDKDFQAYENSLQDFFLSPDGKGYLKRNHVDAYRIEEISELLQDLVLNERQSFWDAVCRIRPGISPMDWSAPEQELSQLAGRLHIDEADILEFDAAADISNLSAGSNIPLLAKLIKSLKVSFETFRQRSMLPVSFFLYHQQRFDAYRQSLKATYEYDLFHYLQKGAEKDQERFAQLLLDYDRAVYNGTDGLQADIQRLLKQYVIRLFPKLKFAFIKNKNAAGFIAGVYNQNFKTLTTLLNGRKADLTELNRYLLFNKERSLLYFGHIQEIANRYILWLQNLRHQGGGQSTRDPGGVDLSRYQNLAGATIGTAGTVSVPVPGGQAPAAPNNTNKGGGGNGKRFDADLSQQNNAMTGLVAEYMVYQMLLAKKAHDLDWISANAATAGINREGRDDKRYDMTYNSDDGDPQYIEVKGTTGGDNAFFISKQEVDFARDKKLSYHLVFVRHALDNDHREIVDLGNPFYIAPGETLLHNGRYTAVYDTLRILFDVADP
ncbi:sacsin N-terminal ATP-binding-like domain-containing protein [Mucilaginibacter sp. UYCu711]|uniref:DUF3883 domain-containing protein n=1 Tax=Mucilaginibacter sp. UYCu711 TaxID=3156339 RepID=UPI003D1A46A9